jgi:integrase
MQKTKLTETNIRTFALPANKAESLVADTEVPGLKLRLRRGNDGGMRRSFVFQFSRSGQKNKSPKLKLGDVGGTALADARKLAREHIGALARGQDPVMDRQAAKIKQAETFQAILPRYLNFKRSRLRTGSFAEVQRHLAVYAQPLHPMPIEKITRRDIATVKAAITEDSGRTSSNRMRTSLCGFFRWCVQEGLLETNVVLNTTVEKEERRSRVLAPWELALVWNHVGEEGDFSAIIRLLMLLGARASEISQLQWHEVHGDLIELAPERVKNAKPHEIPLPPAACDIIERLPRRTNPDGSPRDFVFGIGVGGFDGFHVCKQRLDRRIAEATGKPLAPWRVHDIRHSFSTHLNEIGVAPHIVEVQLGHISGFRAGVAGRYNHAAYRSERRRALELWAETLLAWVAGKTTKVVTLRQPA